MRKPTKFHTHKIVEYSYSTSTNAERFGFYKTGCYTVTLTDPTGVRPPVALSAYATKDEALNVLDSMSHPESTLMRYVR